MTFEEYKAFEYWLMSCYKSNNNVDFAVLAQALKSVRSNVR